MRRKLGRNLKVGDVIKVWWSGESFNGEPNTATIAELKPYTGKILFGARVASMEGSRGMTIQNSARYHVVGNRKKMTTKEKDLLVEQIIEEAKLPADYRGLADAIYRVLKNY